MKRASHIILLATLVAVFSRGGGMPAKGKPSSWRVIDDALFRVNDVALKDWGVYQTGKKRDPLLLQMNYRFLLIRIHERQLFEIDSSRIQRKADELLWDPSDRPAQPLAIADWDASDAEAVFRIRVKIIGEDHLLDIELPHPLDLSGMTPHRAPPRD